ncbi:DNA primase [Paraglaciecola Antarctic GD virus 1]|nr:DNA primase [Paraglaciecola Antarctic GD virus 1]
MEMYMQKDLAKQIMPLLSLSVITSTNPLKINFRCPVCGDSRKDKYKCRAWFYEKKGNMKFGCFNCDSGNYIVPFAMEHFANVWESFRILNFQGRQNPKKPDIIESMVSKSIKYSNHSYRCVNLFDDDHEVVKYLLNRKIPRSFFKEIFYTSTWKKCADQINEGIMGEITKDYPRIVFPLRDKNGTFGLQGRDLGDHPAKYQTILSSESAIKVWGTHRVNDSKRVFILEGIIDAMFIANAIAMLGGTGDTKLLQYNDKVWVLDNEPRHKDTKKRMNKLIREGEQVLIWLRCPFKGKDVNEMVQNGASIVDINKYMWKHVYSGLMAQAKMSEWSK